MHFSVGANMQHRVKVIVLRSCEGGLEVLVRALGEGPSKAFGKTIATPPE
jgi:hypothetical protein